MGRHFIEVEPYRPEEQIEMIRRGFARKIDDHWAALSFSLNDIEEIGERKADSLDLAVRMLDSKDLRNRDRGVYVVDDIFPHLEKGGFLWSGVKHALWPSVVRNYQHAGDKLVVSTPSGERIGWEWKGYDYGALGPGEVGIVYRGSTLTLLGTQKHLVRKVGNDDRNLVMNW